MADFLILIHDDARGPVLHEAWPPFIDGLINGGHLKGGSSLGLGETIRYSADEQTFPKLAGYLLIQAPSINDARVLIASIPDCLSGATVQVLPLVEDG